MYQEDASHIQRAQHGDQQAFQRLVNDWYPRIYNYAWKYFSGQQIYAGAPHDLASEVAQRTFIAVHHKFDQLADTKKFRSWLYRIATNYCYDEDRRRQRKRVFAFGQLGSHVEHNIREHRYQGMPGPEKHVGHNEMCQWLKKALAELPEEQKVVVIMKEYEGLKFREIAEILQISENTAKSRLYYGLNALRKVLQKWNINQETIQYE